MKKTRILFVCKYNRFRSRTAEAYFKKINGNKNIVATSAGIIPGYLPLDKTQVKVTESFGFSILGKPKAMNMKMLNNQDKIIVVADDVPREIFMAPQSVKKKYDYRNRVIFWKIPDVSEGKNVEQNKKIIKAIIIKVDELNKELERENGTG